MSESDDSEQVVAHIYNSTSSNLALHVEPAGHQYTLPPSMHVDIVAYKQPEGTVIIDIEDNRVAVWGWTTKALDIYFNGEKLMTDQGYTT